MRISDWSSDVCSSDLPVAAPLLVEQLQRLCADSQIAVVKLGLLGNAPQVAVIANLLRQLRVPVICDPVLRAGGGTDLAANATVAAQIGRESCRERVCPYV